MISSLIFCFVVGAVLAAEEDSRSAYIKTQKNKRLHGYVVKKIDSTDEMSCSQACLRHSWCTSSNFKESSGNCELNKHEFSTTDDDTRLTDNPGTTFSMFLKGCLMAGCLNGGSCLFDERKDAFACSCSPQWRGEKCEMDINECETGKHHCDSNALYWKKINHESVCYKAKDSHGSFRIIKQGLIHTFKLVHRRGSLKCAPNIPATFWGCTHASYDNQTLSTVITYENKSVLSLAE
ncbi:uncharacterized protein [Porites lutea]|uniref:uncharacterized protein n=1 Tax=Porites lutea TaxID=51062 RepID=UPI003CC52E11